MSDVSDDRSPAEPTEAEMAAVDSPVVARALRLGHGFHEDEFDRAVYWLHRLDHRLTAVEPDKVDLHLSVKDRSKPEQRTVLEAEVAGWGRVVGTSSHDRLWSAVVECREEVLRQMNDARDRHDPKHRHHNH